MLLDVAVYSLVSCVLTGIILNTRISWANTRTVMTMVMMMSRDKVQTCPKRSELCCCGSFAALTDVYALLDQISSAVCLLAY